jgi:hypothetical protein
LIGVVLAAGWLWYRHRRGWGTPMIRPSDEAAAVPDATTAQPEPSAG